MSENSTLVPLYNPDLEDFSVRYDIDGTGKPKTFTIKCE